MPHVIDKDTGLCIVCNRLEIAAIKEGKKFKRQQYDVRKLAIDRITDKQDPNYRAITNRHYVKYRDSLDESKELHKDAYYLTFDPEVHHRNTFTKKMPVNHAIIEEKFEDEFDQDEEVREIESKRDYLQSVLEYRSKSQNDRKRLRKINLAQASRLNQVPTITYQVRTRGTNSTPQLDVIETHGIRRDTSLNQLHNHELGEHYDYVGHGRQTPKPLVKTVYKKKVYNDYNDYDVESEYIDTERSSNFPTARSGAGTNRSSKKAPTARNNYTNRSGYTADDYDYESDHEPPPLSQRTREQRKPVRLQPIDKPMAAARRRAPSRPVIVSNNEEYIADDEFNPTHVKHVHTTTLRRPQTRGGGYVDDEYDDGGDVVQVVRTKPTRRRKIVVYHNLDENGEEEGDPQVDVSYEDPASGEFYAEEPLQSTRNRVTKQQSKAGGKNRK